jgi:hypothetical protein
MADVSGKFFSAVKVRTGVSPSSPGSLVGEPLEPVNPPGGGLNSVGVTMPSAFAVANSPLTSNGTIQITGAGTIAQYVRGDGTLETFPSLTGFVPYTGATADVNLGTHDLTAERGTFENNGSSDTLTVNHTSGSGYGIEVTKGGNNEALYVNKTSGSGNAMAVVGGRTALVDLSLSSVSNATGNFLTISGGVVHQRTPSETRSDVGAQAQLNGTGFVKASGTTISYDNSTYQVTSEKGQPNGYASLDSNGKVPLVQINDALIGNVNFQGLWNAATNTPTLANPPASGTKGHYYIVSTAGTFASISFEVGDWIISDGTAWGKVDNTDAVSSVFGRTGNVTASNGDYNTSQVTENTNLYFTNARAIASVLTGYTSGAGTISAADSILSAIQKLNGNIGGLTTGVSSVFGRTGAVVAVNGDYYLGTTAIQAASANQGLTGITGITFVAHVNDSASITTTISSTSTFFDFNLSDDNLNDEWRWRFNPSGASVYNAMRLVPTTNTTSDLIVSGAISGSNLSGTNTGNVTLGTANGLGLTGQQLSLGLASAGVTGALSGTDWSTFNSKQQALNGTGFVKISGTTISYDNSTYYLASNPSAFIALTALSGTAPIQYNNTTGAISITQASGSTNGFLSSTDWNTFNNKANSVVGGYLPLSGGTMTGVITTPNGTFGIVIGDDSRLADRNIANTLFLEGVQNDDRGFINFSTTTGNALGAINGGDLTWRGNVVWHAGNITPVPTSRTITINGTTQDLSDNRIYNVGTVTSVAALTLGTTGTDLSSSVANGTTTPVITLNVPTASAANRGALSAADWTTFNNKQNALTNPVTGTGTAGQVAYWSSASAITGESNLFWDAANDRLGIGTASPQATLDVNGATSFFRGQIAFTGSDGVANGISLNYVDGASANSVLNIRDNANSANRVTFLQSGNVGIGTASPAARLEIFGTGNTLRLDSAANGAKTILLRNVGTATAEIKTDGNLDFNIEDANRTMRFLTSNTERMRITSTGNVGIGTNAPSNPLHVNAPVGEDGFDAIPVLFIRNTTVTSSFVSSMIGLAKSTGNMTDGFGPRFLFSISDDTFGDRTNQIAAIGGIRTGADNSGSIIFQTATTGTNTTKIQVFPTGNTTIQNGGTFTDAGFRLDVNGTARVSGAATFSSSVTAASFIPSGSTIPANGMYLPSANIIAFSTNTNERMSITSTGDILFKGKDTTGSLDARFINNGNDLAFYASTNTGGPSKSISFHGRWLANELRMRISINGNVLIGTDTDTSDKLRVGGNTFTDTITTLRPDTESKSVAWRLGVVSGGTTTPDRLIRVMVGGIEYNIPAREA